MENQLTLRFTGGADLKPQALRAKELADIIENFEAAITAAVVAHDPTIKREQVAVALIAVNDQSIGLAFAPNLPELTYPAAFRIAEAFATQRFAGLPASVLSPLRGLVRFVRQRGCIAEVKIKRGVQTATISITAQTRIEAFTPVDGETILYGQVIRAGGVDPKVELKPPTGKALFCSTTEEIAIQLANRLYYDNVKLGEMRACVAKEPHGNQRKANRNRTMGSVSRSDPRAERPFKQLL